MLLSAHCCGSFKVKQCHAEDLVQAESILLGPGVRTHVYGLWGGLDPPCLIPTIPDF